MTETSLAMGRLIQLVQTRHHIQGKDVVYEKARRAPGVRLLIPSKDGRQVLLTREYRLELGAYDYRLPGGKVFDTLVEFLDALNSGAKIELAARNKAVGEGAEEAGLAITDIRLVERSVAGATIEWDLYCYEVTDYVDTGEQALEHGEDITVAWFPVETAFKMALSGEMRDDRAAAVFMRWLYSRGVLPS